MGLFSFIGGLIGGGKQAKATKDAAKLQYDATMAGIAETQRQFDVTRSDYAPYQALGAGAAPRLGNLAGTNGMEAQLAEIEAIKNSPYYQQLMNNGRESMLATASATGGLRGGNFQDASQRFGADTLVSAIDKQLANYAGLVGIGTGATDSVSGFGERAVASSNELRNSGAAANAQARLVQGGIAARSWNNAGGFLDDAMSAALGGGGGGFSFKSLF